MDRLRRLSMLSWGLVVASMGVGLEPVDAYARASSTVEPICSVDDLIGLDPSRLEALYAAGIARPLPPGPIRGRALPLPGTRVARSASRVAGLLWQGKVIDESGESAVNRFFGMKIVRGNLAMGTSVRDGGPALILDYGETSLIYRRYRDEIREVAPGVYLGLMFADVETNPRLTTYFALQAGR
ncbi:MAG: hypothetical protein SFX72_04190 [Isosphaeraceae bacterium]|nr:hypothetical protein [Isosphaeraceae bacterium]